jgi:thiol:disulfide interchange protein/DsbC/DsbD-like thiol-disulfide interchange protein
MYRSHSLLATGVISIWLTLLSPSAQALSSQAATDQVQAQLVASVRAVRPGDQVVLGVQQRIIPHWHTYWRNPGDSGIATTIAWTLPMGASADDIQWPTPSRFNVGPVTNLGYEKEVTLLTSVQVPENAKAGESFPIQAKVNWLVCQEVCIPQEVQLELVLPIVQKGATIALGSPLINQAKARLPVTSPWPVQAEQRADKLALKVTSPELQSAKVKDIWFYPAKWGQVVHNAEQVRRQEGDALVLDLQSGEDPVTAGGTLSGVLVVTEDSGDGAVSRGFTVETMVLPGVATSVPQAAGIGLGAALGLALLGGLILNLMPCVFPVLSIKALALLSHAEQTPAQKRLHGLVYTLGVLASFTLLAGLLIALKAGGAQVGWGFQFQSPLFVLAVAYLMFAVGLSLSGVFSIGGSVAGVGSSLAERPGYSGAFFTGVLATIVATPCTAPFMGGAMGYALAQPAGVLLAVFLSLGLGLALPYLALSTWPALQRALPRPGLWMERVKQGFAFPMYATAAWLVWVLAQQAGINSVAISLAGMVVIAFAAWLYESFRHAQGWPRLAGLGVANLALLTAIVGGYMGIGANAAGGASAVQAAAVSADQHWEPYTEQRLQDLRAKGEPVFVNMTAAWCITCLVNERVALSESSVTNAFKEAGITYLKGDWTNQDQQITKLLAQFGRIGVPLYAFYPKGMDAAPVVLPQLLTSEIVLSALKAAPIP